jgi:hypothetical protein
VSTCEPTTCADSTGSPEVMVQTCRSWTSCTAGSASRCVSTSSRPTFRGAASSSTSRVSRSSFQVRGTIITAITGDATGSAAVLLSAVVVLLTGWTADGPQRVRRDLEEGAAHVETPGPAAGQQEHGHRVRGQADQGEDDGQTAVGRLRLDEAVDRLVHHVTAHPEQQQTVGRRGEDPGAGEAEGTVPARRPVRDVHGEQRHAEPQGVRGHVRGVGDQGEGAGEDATGDLHRRHADRDPQGAVSRPR